MTKEIRMKRPNDLSSRSMPNCHYLSLIQSGQHPSDRRKRCSRPLLTEDTSYLAYAFLWIAPDVHKQAVTAFNESEQS